MSNNFDDIDNDAQNVVESDISQAVQSSYLDYAMSVIVSRALPDVRDGLKPVQRRILYSMYDCGFFHNKPHRKSARIVGDVMGKYHPHGDSSIYYAMVRMQQEFSLREPMIDGQGNFGSIDGDMPASMRYTESRLSKIANSLLEDIHYQTVDFKPNYDGLDTEPLVLPSKIPNLLVNGSSGIAVGMATNIPPHNLGQVIDACCLYVDNVDVSIEDLISSIEGPDFPSSSTVNAKDLNLAYKTGKGVISIKGKAEVEVRGNKESIVITQIPYTVNKAKLVEKIAELAKESKIEGIADLRDESSGDGIRVVVDLKQGVVSDIVMLKLYTLTPLQTSYGINMLALDRGIPRLMNLKDIIRAFVNFRREVIYKRSTFLVNQALAKKEILGGILTAVDHIEMIINIIRKSKDTESAKKNLMSIKWDSNNGDISFSELSLLKKDDGFYLTERQAKAILEMRLQKLTNLEKNKILAELEALFKEIKYYNEVLNSEIKLLGVLKEELLEIKKQFATKRLTKISNDGFDAVGYEELIPEEEMIATFTLSGYVKRVKLDAYKPQNRGGKGKIGVNVASDDIITKVIVGSSHSNLLFFTNIGRVYRIKMHQLPVCSLNSRGKQISSIVPFAASEAITSILIIPHDDTSDNQDLVFSTAKGKVRRNKLTDFDYIPVNGKIAMKLSDRDELIGVSLCSQDKEVFLATDYGKCIKFALKDLRIFKSRNSDGVRGIKLATSHKVITQVIVDGCKYNFSQRDRYLSIKLDVRKKLNEPQLPLALEKSLYKSKILSEDFLLKDVKSMAEQEVFLLSVTERGYAKCSSSYEYRTIARGGSGVANIAASEKIGKVVQVVALDSPQDQELIVVTSFGKTVRVKLANIRITGRNTLGVVLVKMSSKKEKVVSVALCSMETLTL